MRLRLAPWLVAVLGMLAAACGGTSTSSNTATQQAVTVRWGYGAAVGAAAPILADRWGYFKQEGITADFLSQPSGVTLTQALLAGDLDFISTGVEIPMTAAEQGQQLRNVVGETFGGFAALMVLKDSPAQSFTDLKGKKVGVAAIGSRQDADVRVYLAQNGMKPTDVTIIGVGNGAAAVAALKTKQIDALWNTDPAIQLLTLSGDARIILDLRKGQGGSLTKTPSAAVTATLAYISKNTDVVHRVVRAMTKALKRAHDHPDQAYTIYKDLDIFKALDPAVLMNAVTTDAPGWNPVLTQDSIQILNDNLKQAGILKQDHPFGSVVATQFEPDWKTAY